MFLHRREPAAIDNQTVIRLNRDTLYSAAVFDLDAGRVTVTPPEAGRRFTAKAGADGSIDVQFGGYDGKIANCLPTPRGWNYLVRLYRPGPEILDGSWKFPEPRVAN